jgi:hypothetical protein
MTALLTLDVGSRTTDLLREAVEGLSPEDEGRLLREETASLVRRCLAFPEDVRDQWRVVKAAAEAGLVRDYDALGKGLERLFNVQAWLLSRIADIARKVKLKNSQDVEGARDLEGVTAELERLRRQILTNWPWSDLPPPPIDREMIRLSREAHARNEQGEDVTTILERLHNGGPL